MAKKAKKSLRVSTGTRFDPSTLDAIERYRARSQELSGFEVRFSDAIRVLVAAGLAATSMAASRFEKARPAK